MGVITVPDGSMLVVYSMAEPALNLTAIDKCLVMGISSEIPCALAITKTDLAEPPDLSFYAKHFPFFTVSTVSKSAAEGFGHALRLEKAADDELLRTLRGIEMYGGPKL